MRYVVLNLQTFLCGPASLCCLTVVPFISQQSEFHQHAARVTYELSDTSDMLGKLTKCMPFIHTRTRNTSKDATGRYNNCQEQSVTV